MTTNFHTKNKHIMGKDAEFHAAPAAKNFWESSGFLLSIVMLIGSAWGLKEQDGQAIVAAFTGLIATGATVWHFFKSSKFRGWLEWVKDSNTWNYMAGAVLVFLPNAGALFPALKGIVDAIIAKNLGLILSSVVTLGVVIFNVFIKKNTQG